MPETATVTLAVELGSGQRWARTRSLEVEAVDIVTVVVPKREPPNTPSDGEGGTEPGNGGGDGGAQPAPKPTVKKVAVQPGAAGKVKFMLVTSSVYPEPPPDKPDELKLSFQTSKSDTDHTEEGDPIALDEPQLIVGRGMMKMLGGSPTILHIKNDSDQDALITIVVGRDGTA